MPVYVYKNPETGETVEVVQKMNDFHIYIDYDGLEWHRVFTAPNAAVDTKIDGCSSQDFVDKTRGKGMTMGQLWDESAAASEKRESKLGHDPVKKEFFKKYSEKRKGMKHQGDSSQ